MSAAVCTPCEESPVRCAECGKHVCPQHRIGTGALSEGYSCSLGCSLIHAGMVPRPKETFTEALANAPRKYGVVPIIAAVIVIVWSVLAALIGK